jgi:hypothetical protein
VSVASKKARITPFILLPEGTSLGQENEIDAGAPLSNTVPLDSFSTGDQPSLPLGQYGMAGSVVAKEIDCLNLQPSQEALHDVISVCYALETPLPRVLCTLRLPS